MEVRNKVFIGAVSAALMSAATYWEGYRPQPYEDVVKKLTVCMGHTGKDIENKTYTRAECDNLLKKDLAKYGEQAIKCINVPINENQYNSFTLFTYNLGASNFCNAGFVKKLNQGKYEEACVGMYKHPDGSYAWSFAGGKFYQGLQNRRKFESDLCLGKDVWKTLPKL